MISIEDAIAIEKPSSFRPAFVAISGGLIGGVMLNYVWDAAAAADDLHTWIPIHPEYVQEAAGLSYNEQKSARAKLVHRRLIEETIRGDFLHLRLNVEEIELAIVRALRTQARQRAAEMSD